MKENVLPSIGIYYRTNEFLPNRKTLVFIHGLSGNSSAWDPYEKYFGRDFNILTFDLRGHGRSRKYSRESDYALDLFVDDIEALLDHLKIEKCIIISHSFGSVISANLIEKNPDRMQGAIFLAPAFEPNHSALTWIMHPISSVMAFLLGVLPISEKPGEHVDYSRLIPTSDWDMRRIRVDIHNTGLAIYFFCLHSLYCSMNDHYLDQLRLPVIIIHGKRDSYVSLKYSVQASKKIIGSELVVLPDADHMLVFDYIGDISNIMTEFLASLPS